MSEVTGYVLSATRLNSEEFKVTAKQNGQIVDEYIVKSNGNKQSPAIVFKANPLNRTFCNIKKIDELGTVTYDTVKETRTLKKGDGTQPSAPRISWQEYITEEEKKQLEAIRQQCLDRAKIAKYEAIIKNAEAEKQALLNKQQGTDSKKNK